MGLCARCGGVVVQCAVWRVRLGRAAYLHLVEEGAGGEQVVAALGVLGHVRARPERLAGARHAHHQHHLRTPRPLPMSENSGNALPSSETTCGGLHSRDF